MTAVRLIALMIGAGMLYVLKFAAGWPWYYAVPGAIACYLAIRVAAVLMGKDRGPTV